MKIHKGYMGVLALPLALSMLGMSGCASTQGYVSNVDYEKFYDSFGEYKLVGRNNDIYLEKLDGSESKQVTHSPKLVEEFADFIDDGKYVHFRVGDRRFIIDPHKDGSEPKEISSEESTELLLKTIKRQRLEKGAEREVNFWD